MGLAETEQLLKEEGIKQLCTEREALSSEATADTGKRAGSRKETKRVRKVYIWEGRGREEQRMNNQVKASFDFTSPLGTKLVPRNKAEGGKRAVQGKHH